MSESTPLVELRGSRSESVSRTTATVSRVRWIGAVSFGMGMTVVAVVLGIVLAVVSTGAEGSPSSPTPEPPPSPSPDADPFPIRPPQYYNLSEAGHVRDVQFSVPNGTWMSVDFLDDTTIVFDLLGDVYTIPLAGGAATPLVTGVPFDWQPRVSPDRTRLLFTSDRLGAENLFVMDLASRVVTAVSSEDYRCVSNGVWLDEETVVGVKWFTGTGTIPGGELWMYKADGSAPHGDPLVQRASPTFRVGPEEPFVPSDRQHVYYSENTADTGFFSYSKNPHRGIYSVRRMDLQTRTIETVAGGAGGACRPAVSHDGSTLAFVRRVEFASVLVLRDLSSGEERTLIGNLGRDQQASSAPAGVYPFFVWSPDDSFLVLWAGGLLWRVAVTTGDFTQIPFEVDVHLKLRPTVRGSEISWSRNFSSHTATHVTVTASRGVVFHSVGGTYVLDAESSAPRRITERMDGFEFSPAVSSDGNILYHVVWNDVDFARLERIDLTTNTPEILELPRGRYADIAVHPSNPDVLLISRLGADAVTGSTFALGSGVYSVNVEALRQGEPAMRMLSTATSAAFSADALRVMLYFSNEVRMGTWNGVGEPLGDISHVLSAPTAPEISVSPTRQHVAFMEFYQVYVVAVGDPSSPHFEDPLTAAPPAHGQGDTSDRPGILRVSRNGGQEISWSTDGTRMRWTLGATMFEVHVPGAIAACLPLQEDRSNGRYLPCMEEYTTTTSLAVSVEQDDISDHCLAIANATVVTFDGTDEPLEDGVIIVHGDRITDVGASSEVPIPEGCDVIDAEGAVVVPGFIDAHAHWAASRRVSPQTSWEYLLNLAYGVTTVHNPSHDTLTLFSEADLVRSGRKLGPRLHGTGTILYGAEGWFRAEINNAAEAREAISRIQAYGGISVKSYCLPNRGSRLRLLDAAEELGCRVVPEGGMAWHWMMTELVDGHTTLEHNSPIAPMYADVQQLALASGTMYTPTLVVSFGGMWGEIYNYQEDNVWEVEKLRRFHPIRTLNSASIRRTKAPVEDYHHVVVAETTVEMQRKGVNIGLGAHGQRQGIAFHWEMQLLAQGGATPIEVLRAATAEAADGLNLGEVGRIRAGALADLVLFRSDAQPLADIHDAVHIRYVLQDGRLLDPETMGTVWPEESAPPVLPQLNIPTVGGNLP